MRQTVEYIMLDSATATATGLAILCEDYRHAIFSLSSSDTATVKFQGAISSVGNAAPDFSSSRSATNVWDFIEVIDLESGSAIDGDTGIATTGADYRLLEANINGLKYLSVDMTPYTSGAVTVKCKLFND